MWTKQAKLIAVLGVNQCLLGNEYWTIQARPAVTESHVTDSKFIFTRTKMSCRNYAACFYEQRAVYSQTDTQSTEFVLFAIQCR